MILLTINDINTINLKSNNNLWTCEMENNFHFNYFLFYNCFQIKKMDENI